MILTMGLFNPAKLQLKFVKSPKSFFKKQVWKLDFFEHQNYF